MTNQYKVSDKDFNLPLAPLWVFYRISCTERHKALFCERKANMKLHFKPKAHSWSLFGSPVTLFLGLSWRHHLQLGWGRNRSMSREIEGKHVLSSSWGRRTFRGSSWGNCCSQTVFFLGIIPCVLCEELPLWIWDAVSAVEAFCVSGCWHIDACRTRRLVGGKNKRESTWELLYCLPLLPFSSAWDSGCFLLSNQDNRWLNKLTP